MNKKLFDQAVEKIPEVIAKLKSYEAGGEEMILATVREYTRYGSMCSKNAFVISVPEMINHIQRAKRMPECEVIMPDYDDPNNELYVTIKRTLRSGGYYIAEYKPTIV